MIHAAEIKVQDLSKPPLNRQFDQALALKRRLAIMYPGDFSIRCIESKPKDLFFNYVKEVFQMTNRPYDTRRDGVFYRENYIIEPHTVEDERYINWCANEKYFDLSMQGGFCVKEGALPSEALQAFFKGPTIAECQTVLQAAYWWGLLNILGSKEFDKKFKLPCLPFYMNVNPNCDGNKYKEKMISTPSPIYYFLEEVSSEIVLKNGIHIGDYLYIKGHPRYLEKHPAGSSPGWNVVCVGYNEQGLPLFTSFSPLKFKTPKTYNEIITYLVDGFNDPLSDYDKAKGGQALDGIIATKEDIIGVMGLMRFNLDRALSYNPPLNFAHKSLVISEKGEGSFLGDPIPFEDKGNTFETYKRETALQQEMYDLVFKFSNAPYGGLVLTGAAGIGKTHLAMATAQHAITCGKKVLYLCAENISKDLDTDAKTIGIARAIEKLTQEIEAYIALAPDLIVLDDLNSKFSFGAQFQRLAIGYTLKHKKRLMITANEPVLNLYEGLEDIYKLDDDRANYFVLKQGCKG